MSVNWFDIIVFAILMAFMLLSYVRGAFRELLSLIGLLGGMYAGLYFGADLGALIVPIVQDQSLAEILTFVMALVAGYLLGSFLGGLADIGPKGLLNNVLGGVIGIVKGLVVAMSVYWIVAAHVPPFQPQVVTSRVAPYLDLLLGMVQSLVL